MACSKIGLLAAATLAVATISGSPASQPAGQLGPEPVLGDRKADGSRYTGQSRLKTLVAPIMNADAFHKTDDLLSTELDTLSANCPIVSVESISGVKVVTVAKGTEEGKVKIVYNFGIHGRELISSEVGLKFLQDICGTPRGQAILEYAVFKVVPVLNVFGRQLAESGGACDEQRKNANAVDLNRNFDIEWDQGNPDQTAQDFRGSEPLSEPETAMLSSLVQGWKPKVFIDIHSGDNSILMPWSFKAEDCEHCEHMMSLLQHINNKEFGGQMAYGAGGKTGEDPYTCSGVSNDYMYSKLGVEYSLLFEVFSKSQQLKQSSSLQTLNGDPVMEPSDHTYTWPAHTQHATNNSTIAMVGGAQPTLDVDDCFAYFNPTSRAGLQSKMTKWSSVLMTVAEYLKP